jgi:GWxTD domain-containing protein
MFKRMFTRKTMRGTVLFLISALVFSSVAVFAQDEKESKKKQKRPKESLKSVYKRWIDEDVRWIITDEENKTFKALKTDDEREQFIEQFWLRRDPDPDTDSNEYREEYYQRIAYSNEKFTSGIPGWKTDRGRIYIMFGKPDQIESHPSGGSYDRPTWEGGGTTSTYPFEIWWYRYIEGVGSDVEIEFVDPTGSGEYRIARSPYEKDALLYVPNAGLTLSEQLGLSSKADRVAYGMFGPGGGGAGGQMFGMRAKDQPFEKLDLLAKLQRPPRVRFNDLAALANESELPKASFDVLPVNLVITQLRVTESAVLTSFMVQMEHQDLVFKDVGGIQQAAVNIYAKITNAAGRRVGQFEKLVTAASSAEALAAYQKTAAAFMENLVLPPGIYKIDLVVRDVNSGRTDVKKVGFRVVKYEEGKLATSTMILASSIKPLTGRLSTGMFVFGSLKVIPNATFSYKTDQSLGIYMQVYNVQIDQATLKPSVDIEYVVTQKEKEVMRIKEDGKNGLSTINSQQITLAQLIQLKDFKPGSYDVHVVIKDNVANQMITTPKENFQVKESASNNLSAK